MRRQLNNIVSFVLMAAFTLSIFSSAKYSDAGLYINDLPSRYEGLSFNNSDRGIVRKNAAADNKLAAEMEMHSRNFINAVFSHDEKAVVHMLAKETEYVCSADGSSFIRYVSGSQVVEGYMASDKKLTRAKQKWCIVESSGTVVCGVNVYIKGIKTPQRWDLHYRKVWGKWKLYMMENGI